MFFLSLYRGFVVTPGLLTLSQPMALVDRDMI